MFKNCLRLISTGFTRIQTTMHGCKLTSAKLPGNSTFFRQSLVPSQQMTWDNASDPSTCNLPQVHFTPFEAKHCNPPFAINGLRLISTGFTRKQTTMHGCKLTSAKLPGNSTFFRQSLVPSGQMTRDNASDPGTCNLPQVHFTPPEAKHCNPPFAINGLRLISTGFTRIQTTMHGCKLTSAKLPGNSTFFRQSLVSSWQMTRDNASDPGTCNLPQVHFTPFEAKHCNPPFAINGLRLISTGFTRIQTTMHGCKLTSAKLPGNSTFFRQSLVSSWQMTRDNASDSGTYNLPQVHFTPPEAKHCNPPFAINGFGRMGKCLLRSAVPNNMNVVAINKPHAPSSFIARSFNTKADGLDINAMFGMDIGGTLTKLVVFKTNDSPTSQTELLNYFTQYFKKNSTFRESAGHWDVHLQMDDVEICNDKGTLHFIRFPTGEINNVLDLCKELGMANGVSTVCATGGGAYKFEDIFKNELNLKLRQYDEFDSFIRGFLFTVASNNNKCYSWPAQRTKCEQRSTQEYTFQYNKYPFIVVNIGSGGGVFAVYGRNHFERISGICSAGRTFSSLVVGLTRCDYTFDEAIELAATGDNFNVDLSVEDIYGSDYDKIGRRGEPVVASSLGKMDSMDKWCQANPEDVVRSVIFAVTITTVSVVRPWAIILKTDRVCFVGNFLRRNPIATKILSDAMMNYGNTAIFLNHEGYSGAIGCLLQGLEPIEFIRKKFFQK